MSVEKPLIFACCGAADVGEIADHSARKVHKEGAGSFFCLSGIGAGLDPFINKTKNAAKVIAIDGCPVDCTKKLLQKQGINQFEFIRVTDLGYTKGTSPATPDAVEAVAAKIRQHTEMELEPS